jgi:hypothetical protein
MSRDIEELSVEEIEKRIAEQLEKEQEHKNCLDTIINCIPLLLSKRRERYLTYICQDETSIYFELKKLYPDLIDLNIHNKYSPIDLCSILEKCGIETKGRKKDYDTFLVEKKKWDDMIISPDKDVFYVCATPERVVMFNVRELPEPIWGVEQHNKTTTYDNKEKIDKMVGYYNPETQPYIDLTEELFKINKI